MIYCLKTEYSISRSIIQAQPLKAGEANLPDQPSNLVDLTKKHGWKKVCLVEDDLGGFLPCYEFLKDLGAQMIYGWRVTICESLEESFGAKYVIFVKSEEGWKSLTKMATLAQTTLSLNGKARLDWETLHKYWNNELLLAVPFYDSFIYQNLFTKNKCIPEFREIRPYIFIEDNDVFFDSTLSEKVKEYSLCTGFPIVQTKTCYYENREDFVYFQARKLMDRKSYGSGGTLEMPNLEYFSSEEFCVESALEHEWGDAEFEKEFEKPLELFLPGIRLPEFILGEEEKLEYGIPDGATDTEVLTILSRHGYKKMLESGEIDKSRAREYGERVKMEIEALEKTHFTPYILLVWDVMQYVNKNGLPRGGSRGSAGGSLVSYLIGITEIDPIKHDLFFERFISVSRAKCKIIDGVKYISNPPDIDIDLSPTAREKVIEYINQKYPGRFAKLATYNTKTTKMLIKDAGKIMAGFSEDEMKVISDNVPSRFGKVAKPEEAYEGSDKFSKSEKFVEFCDKNPQVYKCAKKLYGIISNFGSHASAYIVSYYPLEDFMPLQYGTNNEIVTYCDADVSEKMVIKLDLLGLQSVELLNNVCKSVNFDRKSLDVESWESIYQYLQNLETPSNLFQISGSAAVRGLQKIQPKNFEQLSAVLAICRPGAFEFIDQYASFMKGESERPNLHPLFDDILEKTGYICIYQESLMALAVRVGLNLEEANELRRIVSKKKTDEIAEWEEKILTRAKEKGIDTKAAELVFDLSKKSADYSFNKSHSSAYAQLTALSVYLKFHYPSHFFLEALKLTKDKQDPSAEIAEIVQELPYFGIKLLPPSLTKSSRDFKLEGKNIRFGLESIKGISEKSIAQLEKFIDKERTNLFEMFQSARQSKVNSTVVSALAEIGAFDDLVDKFNRQDIVLFGKIWKELNVKEQNYCLEHGESYGFDLVGMLKNYLNWIGENGKPIGKESRLETIRKKCKPFFEVWRQNKQNPMISQWLFEKKLLGYCPSITLSELFQEFPYLSKIDHIKNGLNDRDRVNVIAEVLEIKTGVSKKSGEKYAKIKISDETGSIETLFTGDRWARHLSSKGEPEEGQLIYIRGSKGGNGEPIIFIDNAEIQAFEIYSRVSDLKKLEGKEVKVPVEHEI